jgi:hypothetical protein
MSTDLTSAPTGASQVAGAGSAAASTAADRAKEMTSEAAEQSRAVASEARTQVQHLVSETRSELQQQADAKVQQMAGGLRNVSGSITALLDGRPDEAQALQGYLQQARTRMDRMADRVEQGGPQGVVDDLSSFARRRPGAFLLAAGVGGFAIGHLARAGAGAGNEQLGSPAIGRAGFGSAASDGEVAR